MVVKIEEIGQDGLELDEPIPFGLLDEVLAHQGKDTGFRPRRGAQLKASLEKVSGGVLLKGAFVADLSAPCKRCLSDVSLEIPVSFVLNLVPRGSALPVRGDKKEDDGESECAGSFDEGVVDDEYFDGKTIDLDPIISEQVLLALPISVVCQADCKGLCIVCGQNLNEQECGCERKILDPRLAALRDIKLN